MTTEQQTFLIVGAGLAGPAILLRESYREGDKVKNRTPANPPHWP